MRTNLLPVGNIKIDRCGLMILIIECFKERSHFIDLDAIYSTF
ncbi:MAG: hypothetical protein ACRC2R_02200 [Xenococcaceae cyanobacterium]